MKKILALLMAVVMVLSFAACGTDKDDEKDGASSSVPEISDTVPADDAAANNDLADGAGNASADDAGADTKLPVDAPEGADSLPADSAAPQPKN